MYEHIEDAFKFLFIIFIIFVPLGLWKLIEIIIWIIKHVKITIS
jgi:hypothetical protein